MNDVLNEQEIATLTAPRTQHAAQARHISKLLGCDVKRRPDGFPIVTRSMLQRLDPANAPTNNESGLNWGT